ncbi:Transglycosylase SLT domain-containing protein [Psychrobacillus sp. OK028]|uniref:S-layer homology domain-containing protein n=1 Tax=Psychrobacillus sp. OK028 TaxID=1884359 RepID=UPI0008888B4B|nr:S-layer homology domain-containing protein [Psychrobacillus sp. OK028]SDM35313.1 Transglycosylase SLT domain-containing protein [Psychrobacillus sp. OK028]
MKKIIAMAVILLLLGSSNSVFAQEQQFIDVKSDNQFKNHIYYLYEQNVINGKGPNTFAPKENVTRGEAALMLARALKLNTTKRETVFSDVPSQKVSSGAVQSAFEAGIINGKTKTTFGIDEPITRGDMASLIARAFKLVDEEVVPFEDVAISSSAYSSIGKVYAAGIAGGYSPVKFEVNKPVTREQFSAFLARALNDDLRLSVNKCGYDSQSRVNPDRETMNCLLTDAARDANIPPEIVKAVATIESGWVHFQSNGEPTMNRDIDGDGKGDGGIGLMQITNNPKYDETKLKYDLKYNLKAGIEILQEKYKLDLPKIGNHNPADLESWYFALLAYNGTKAVNSPFYSATGLPNYTAYQEKVYKALNDFGLVKTNIGSIDMKSVDFTYNEATDYNIIFNKKNYTLSGKTPNPSKELLKEGAKVKYNSGKMRKQPSTQSADISVPNNAVFTIIAGPVADSNASAKNNFVWYPAQTEVNGKKVSGYIASYLIIQ